MSRRAVGLEELRARYRLLHGAAREDAAHWLALALVVEEVVRGAVARRERREAWFALERRRELDRWDMLRARFGQGWTPRARVPPWLAPTWEALASLAAARAKETEWYQTFERCSQNAARALERIRKPRTIVMYGNDGMPRMFHVERKGESEDNV